MVHRAGNTRIRLFICGGHLGRIHPFVAVNRAAVSTNERGLELASAGRPWARIIAAPPTPGLEAGEGGREGTREQGAEQGVQQTGTVPAARQSCLLGKPWVPLGLAQQPGLHQ